MQNVAMIRRAALVGALAIGLSSSLALSGQGAAPQPVRAPVAAQSFTIPADGGYGLDTCLTEGGACGSTVADAWCASHGFAQAASFGPADEPRTVRVDCRA